MENSSRTQDNVKVPIKSQLKKALPVPGIQSRHALATVLSFLDFSFEVIELL